jgi:hypothetical protein
MDRVYNHCLAIDSSNDSIFIFGGVATKNTKVGIAQTFLSNHLFKIVIKIK